MAKASGAISLLLQKLQWDLISIISIQDLHFLSLSRSTWVVLWGKMIKSKYLEPCLPQLHWCDSGVTEQNGPLGWNYPNFWNCWVPGIWIISWWKIFLYKYIWVCYCYCYLEHYKCAENVLYKNTKMCSCQFLLLKSVTSSWFKVAQKLLPQNK